MADTISFRSTTLWSNAGTGIGRIDLLPGSRERELVPVRIAGAVGEAVKDLGGGGTPIAVGYTLSVSSQADVTSHMSTLSGLRDGVAGTLSVTGFGSFTFSILEEAACSSVSAARVVGVGDRYLATFLLRFRKLR